MHTIPHTNDTHLFRVCTGHLAVTVQGDTVVDALQKARKKLCEELPRLWDVIQMRADSDFEVTIIDE